MKKIRNIFLYLGVIFLGLALVLLSADMYLFFVGGEKESSTWNLAFSSIMFSSFGVFFLLISFCMLFFDKYKLTKG